MAGITKEDIVDALHDLGLAAGTGMVIHSSLKSFGHVKGGSQTVIEALMEVVTAEGTLVMPSFNHGAAFADGAPGYYDPTETPTTNGAIPDLFWRQPGVRRSLNPTHPFAVWGRHAESYTRAHHRTMTMGPESPLGLLCADDGYCLLLGVGYHANTFHHVVEMSTGVSCLGIRCEAYPVRLPSAETVQGRTLGWREKSCPFTDEGRYHEAIAARGLQREIFIGPSRATLFRLQDCFEVLAEIFRRGKDGFPPCSDCKIRPRSRAQTVTSDWNPAGQCLTADSPAHDY